MMLLQHYCVVDFIFHFSLFWGSVLSPRPLGKDWRGLFTLNHGKSNVEVRNPTEWNLFLHIKHLHVTLNFIWTSENAGLIYISFRAGNSLGTMQGGFRMNVLWIALQLLTLWAPILKAQAERSGPHFIINMHPMEYLHAELSPAPHGPNLHYSTPHCLDLPPFQPTHLI